MITILFLIVLVGIGIVAALTAEAINKAEEEAYFKMRELAMREAREE